MKKSWFPILIAFVLPLLLVYAWWGGFNSAHIVEASRGPYTYAYLMHRGDYTKLPDTQHKLEQHLRAQGVPHERSITVLLDDPRKTARADLRAHVGFLVAPDTVVKAPLLRGEVPRRQVLVASVNAAVLLAPSKAYQALYDYQQAQQRDLVMPTVEFYSPASAVYRVGVLTVEMQP